jgi:glucokinase
MLDGWSDVPLADLVAERLGVPCVVDNDVNNAARAELRARRPRVPRVLLLVGVGTGIGGAIAIEGRVYRGANGGAGEIGNTTVDRGGAKCWCGRRGCLNTLASGAAIEQHLALRAGSLPDAVARREPRVLDALEAAGQALGSGIANALNLLNPDLVVLAGGLAELPPALFLEPLERSARAEAFAPIADACRFERARAGYEAAAVGAGWLAWEHAAD